MRPSPPSLISLLLAKFSRYFFALFLVITVLPLIGMLGLSQLHLQDNMHHHQRHLLQMATADVRQRARQVLRSRHRELVRLYTALRAGSGLTPQQVAHLMHAARAWTLDSPVARAFLARNRRSFPDAAATPEADFVGEEAGVGPLATVHVLPGADGHPGLLVIAPVDLALVAPPLPFEARVFWRRAWRDVEHSPPPHDEPPLAFGRFLPLPLHLPPSPRLMGPVVATQEAVITDRAGKTVARFRLGLYPPPPPPFSPQQAGQWVSGFILLAGLLTSVLAGCHIQKNILNPLTRLSEAMHQVQTGDLTVRMPPIPVRHPEIAHAVAGFNAMMDGLGEKEQLRHSFVSNLTHDLRTPLIAATHALEMLAEEFKTLQMPAQQALADGLLKNHTHLLAMVNHLLETYQADVTPLQLSYQPVALPKLVAECLSQLQPVAEARQITLRQHISDTLPPTLDADPNALKRVLINLVGNALDHIPRGSWVAVIVETSEPGWVKLRVRDNGPGLPDTEREQLFDRYYAGTGDTRKLGSGLGLYICKLLVTAHQGDIRVERTPDGETDFILRLPQRQAAPTLPPAPPRKAV